MSASRWWIVAGIGFLVVPGSFSRAADEPVPATPPVPTVFSVSKAHAEACRVFAVKDPEHPFALRLEPILRRQQNTQGNSLGYTFVWLEPCGRPAALCDVFYFKNHLENRHMMNEWHSFADEPLKVVGPGKNDVPRDFLRSPSSGLDWKPVPGADQPADTPAGRRLQLGRLARRFSAWSIDAKERKHELRLLTTPILAYESTDPKRCLAGAIFAHCVETDPECLVVLEARPKVNGFEWRYAPVATSIDEQFLKLDDDLVWSSGVPEWKLDSPHWKDFIKETRIPLTQTTVKKAE